MEGNGASSAGCVVHFDVHVILWMAAECSHYCAWQAWSVLYTKVVECMSDGGSVWYIRV